MTLPSNLKEKARAAHQTGSLEQILAVVLEAYLKQPPDNRPPDNRPPLSHPYEDYELADNAKGWATC